MLVVMTIMVILFSIGVSGMREMRGTALTQLGGTELVSAAKRAQKTALKNGIPTAIVLQASGNGESQGYLFASDGGLETYFGFDNISVDTSGNILAKGKDNTQFVNYTDATAKDHLIDGYFGNGLYIENKQFNFTGTTNNLTSVSNTGNTIYMECQVRYGVGNTAISGDPILSWKTSTSNKTFSINVNTLGEVLGNDQTNQFPTTGRPYIGGEQWKKLGLLINRTASADLCYFFVDGIFLGSGNSNVNGSTSGSLIIGDAGVKVDIDEIKVYNLMKSEPMINDLKAGFFVTKNLNPTNYRKIILLDAKGKLINTSGDTNDFIGFASMSIRGTISAGSSTSGSLSVTGPATSQLPENGYIAVYHSTDQYFELIKYKNFSGGKFDIVERQAAGSTINSKTSSTFYYTIPVIFNTDGLAQ
jgi:type II secretory pathway pseudopilin PulG